MHKYEFSVPMPYEKEHIDKLLEINNEVEKSKITSLFFSLPVGSELFTGFEQYRNRHQCLDFEYWKNLICYCLDKGMDFIYLINSPRPLMLEAPDFPQKIEKLQILLTKLKEIGINKLRVSHPKLLTYLSIHNKDFILYSSTSFEYKTIKEYQNFIAMHPTVKQIVPSHDVNKNFKLLNNLKKTLPDTEIEIMVNEGCLGGCPHRVGHSCEIMHKDIIYNNDLSLSNFYYPAFCNKLSDLNPILQMCKGNHIYPWEIEEYSKIGINKFKLVGRDCFTDRISKYLDEYSFYLKGIDNIKNIEEIPITAFIHHLSENKILRKLCVKDIKQYLPNINYFKRRGYLCASECKAECTYCYKCAKKVQKILDNKLM